MSIVVNIEQQNKELVRAYVGDHWDEFSLTIPPLHVIEHERGIATVLTIYPDSLLPTQIIEINIDDNLDAHMKSNALRHVLFDQLKDIVNKMGVSLNNDYLEITHLPYLIDIAEFFMVVTEIDDNIQTVLPQLLADSEHSKYRFLNAFGKVYQDGNEDADLSEFEYIIDDVSEVSLKMLVDSITGTDGEDIPPENIINRVTLNKDLLDGSLGWTHIRNGGVVGSSVETYLTFFNKELTALLEKEDTESFVAYGKDVISLHMISELNNDDFKNKLSLYFECRVDDLQALINIESLIKSLTLPEPKLESYNESV